MSNAEHEHQCSGELLFTDQYEIDHEGPCGYAGVVLCCGDWYCIDCHESHLDSAPVDHPDPFCWWCMDTGFIVGHFGHWDRCYWRCWDSPASPLFKQAPQ